MLTLRSNEVKSGKLRLRGYGLLPGVTVLGSCLVFERTLNCEIEGEVYINCCQDDSFAINCNGKRISNAVCYSGPICEGSRMSFVTSSGFRRCDGVSAVICIRDVGCGVTAIIGTGAIGCYLLNKLSKHTNIQAFESGIDCRYDGFLQNLSLTAPNAQDHTKYDKVAPQQPPPFPATPAQWTGATSSPVYNALTDTEPAYVSSTGQIIVPARRWSQGMMIGGSMMHIQGVYVNCSENRCTWWAEILKDDRFLVKNLFPKLIKTERFRSHTDLTTDTYDGTPFGPIDGPSAFGSKPVNRGFNGLLSAMQNAPSSFSIALARAIYAKFHDDLGIRCFRLEPVVDDVKSETFNSGVNTCVTTAVETYLRTDRNRSATAVDYLNSSVMIPTEPSVPSRNPGYYINTGPQIGINDHSFRLALNALVQRILFKKCNGLLTATHVVYSVQPALTQDVIVPCDRVILTSGTLGTPAVLMQSGIGPKDVLTPLGIEVLYDQPNLGKYLSNHYGCRFTWTGDSAIWGEREVGTDNSNGYLPEPLNANRRRYQYFSATVVTNDVTTGWQMTLYDLQPRSTGTVKIKQARQTPRPPNVSQTLLQVDVNPNYYSVEQDKLDLVWVFRQVADAIKAKDPSAVFTVANTVLPWPLPTNDIVLFDILVTAFFEQQHFVGTCGMGPDPKVHCVDTNFLLRGTSNVYVCDGSSVPIACEDGHRFPVQNDGNTSRGLVAFATIFADQMKKEKK